MVQLYTLSLKVSPTHLPSHRPPPPTVDGVPNPNPNSVVGSCLDVDDYVIMLYIPLPAYILTLHSTQLNSTGDYGRRCKHLYVRIIMYIFFKKKHY